MNELAQLRPVPRLGVPGRPQSEISRIKRDTALRSVLAASAITLLKIITGIATGSLGMLSEAAHSSIDLLASIMTLFSLRVADMPPDEDHSYGHGRIESLSAFAETLFMLASSGWIIYEAVKRINHYRHGNALALEFSPWPILVLLLSIAVDYARSRQLAAVARESHSQALEAEALHFGTDIWSSVAVLVGLLAVYLGQHLRIRLLELADPLAALIVSVIILTVTYRLFRETVDALLDKTPPETRFRMINAVRRIPGVVSVNQLRMRRAGPGYFADITLGMARTISFQRSEQIVFAVTEAVQRITPGTDVVVHTVPTADVHESVFDRVRAVASRANLSIHDVSIQQLDDGLLVEQHLEVPAATSLRDAHDTVSRIESDMRREVPAIHRILTHIESEIDSIEHPTPVDRDRVLVADLRTVAQQFPEIEDIHDITAMQHGDRVDMSCHCTLPDDWAMDRVHTSISALEAAFLRTHPEVTRLLIHPEPATDNDR